MTEYVIRLCALKRNDIILYRLMLGITIKFNFIERFITTRSLCQTVKCNSAWICSIYSLFNWYLAWHCSIKCGQQSSPLNWILSTQTFCRLINKYRQVHWASQWNFLRLPLYSWMTERVLAFVCKPYNNIVSVQNITRAVFRVLFFHCLLN